MVGRLLSAAGDYLDGCGTQPLRLGEATAWVVWTEMQVKRGRNVICKSGRGPNYELVNDEPAIDLVRRLHAGKATVNTDVEQGRLSKQEGFAAMRRVHEQFWANPDREFETGLSWPCLGAEPYVQGYVAFVLEGGRRFVAYFAKRESIDRAVAYEIARDWTGEDKRIIGAFGGL